MSSPFQSTYLTGETIPPTDATANQNSQRPYATSWEAEYHPDTVIPCTAQPGQPPVAFRVNEKYHAVWNPVSGSMEMIRTPDSSPQGKRTKKRKTGSSPKSKEKKEKGKVMLVGGGVEEIENSEEEEKDNKNWNVEEMRSLIACYKATKNNTPGQQKSTVLWENIRTQLKDKGIHRSVKACKNKFSSLESGFK